MQRGLDSETKKQLEEEEKKIISEEHWYLDLPELKEKEYVIKNYFDDTLGIEREIPVNVTYHSNDIKPMK